MGTCHDTYDWTEQPGSCDDGATATCHDSYDLTEGSLEPTPAWARGVVVVGVDGSPNSIAALRRAAIEAARLHARLSVAFVYHARQPCGYPYGSPLSEYTAWGPAPATADELAREDALAAASVVNECVLEAFGSAVPANLDFVTRPGNPHKVLVELAAGADLLVVGARGHSGALRLVLGSTAAACANHAPCPVLVVPDDRRTRPQGSERPGPERVPTPTKR